MDETFDVYADNFTIASSPMGTYVAFAALSPHFSEGEREPVVLGAVRMSNLQMKLLIFSLWDSMASLEREFDFSVSVPNRVTELLGIPRDRWDAFWGHDAEANHDH